MHGGHPSGIKSVPHALWRSVKTYLYHSFIIHFETEPVHDAHDGEPVGVLPPAAVQAVDHDKVLPDKAVDNAVIPIVKQELSNGECY